jgi:hypothetical protein
MQYVRILSAIGLLVTALACQRTLPEEAVVYTGNWQSKDYALQIYRNGYGVCNSKRYGITIHLEGRVKIETSRIVFIDNDDPNTGRKRFRINQPPTSDPNGLTFMVLDGQRFERL